MFAMLAAATDFADGFGIEVIPALHHLLSAESLSSHSQLPMTGEGAAHD
jgi:hypothetical protein